MEWYPVRVKIGDDVFEDEIRGRDAQDALINAADNWEAASNIEVIE